MYSMYFHAGKSVNGHLEVNKMKELLHNTIYIPFVIDINSFYTLEIIMTAAVVTSLLA